MDDNLYDYVFKGGNLVYGHGTIKSDLYVQDGKIAALIQEGRSERARKVIDATGKYILPGFIDVHTHCDMPVYTDQFPDVTRAAACGGITTIISFVRRRRDLDIELLKSVEMYIENGERISFTDFGIHAAFIPGDTPKEVIPNLIKMGIPSFKMFMAYGARGFQVSDSMLISTMAEIAEQGGIAMIHAENGNLIDYLETKSIFKGRTQPKHFGATRPNLAESEAVSRAIAYAEIVNCPLYFVHISAQESLEFINRAKMSGFQVFAETCPQYLALTDDDMRRMGNLAKIAPPLRHESDIRAMWRACHDRTLDVIGSDHAAYNKQVKLANNNIFDVAFGMPGVETMLDIVYQKGVAAGKITINRMVELLSETPSRIFGLFPKKGVLQVGSDADILLFDPHYHHELGAQQLHSKVDYTPYEGWDCQGGQILTMLRGKIISERGQLLVEPGYGQYLTRGLNN